MYEAKADIEWDMRWSDRVGKSNVSVIVAVTLSVPVVAWFLPPTHQYAVDALELIAKIDPNAPLYFLGSWGLLLAATFGIGQAKSLLMPGRLANLVKAIGEAPTTELNEDQTKAS